MDSRAGLELTNTAELYERLQRLKRGMWRACSIHVGVGIVFTLSPYVAILRPWRGWVGAWWLASAVVFALLVGALVRTHKRFVRAAHAEIDLAYRQGRF